MAKRPNPGRCVHCLKNVDDLTRDHVFPKAWYPDTTPENLERWTIPSCKNCNKEYGKLEEDLLFRLGACLNPEDAKYSGIPDKVLRSIDPECATSREEKRIRQRKREKIKQEIVKWSEVPSIGILPNFGRQSNVNYSEYASIPISSAKLERLGYKIVRGMTYILDKSFIENDHEIKVYFVQNSDAKPIIEKFSGVFETYHKPGIKVERAIPIDRADCGFYVIEIWGRLKIYAIVRLIELPC